MQVYWKVFDTFSLLFAIIHNSLCTLSSICLYNFDLSSSKFFLSASEILELLAAASLLCCICACSNNNSAVFPLSTVLICSLVGTSSPRLCKHLLKKIQKLSCCYFSFSFVKSQLYVSTVKTS